MLVGHLLRRNAQLYPQRAAWTSGAPPRTVTWAEANRQVNRLAHALLGLGLRPGDRVAFLGADPLLLAEWYFALAKVGLVAVPLPPALASREMAYLLRDADVRAVLVDSTFAPHAEALKPLADGVQWWVGVGPAHGQPHDQERLAAKASAAEPTTVIGESAPRAIIYTTSKRDRPLGCVSSHRQFLHSLVIYATQVPFAPDDVCLLVLPLTAGIGYYLLAAYAYAAARTVLLSERDPAAILAAVEQHRPTRLYVTPDLLRALLASPDFDRYDLSSLRLIGCGSPPTPRAVALDAVERLGGHRLYRNFGGGEMGGFVAYLSPGDHQLDEPSGATRDQDRAQWDIVGREAPFVHLRVADTGGRELPRGVVGELLVRSDSVMTGYWQAPADTQRVLRAGWLRTGNLAVMDAAGYVALADRKLLLPFHCGVDADPRAVEATLEEHPAIEAAAAISVPDAECGEGVRALVLLRDDGGATATELEAYCRRSLGEPGGLSRRWFSPAVPRSAVAGLLQRELREEWWPAESLVRGLGAG